MPPGPDPQPPEPSAAFTVLAHDEPAPPPPPRTRHVHVVKPLQRDPAPHDPPDDPPAGPHTILDPKFSRALDFKLRRLRDREVLQANLRRPPRARAPALAAAPSPGRRGRARRAGAGVPPGPPEDGARPRFVTTVRSGQFLLPPPELARLLGLETLYEVPQRAGLVYSYASRPQPVAPRAPPAPARPRAASPPAPAGTGVSALFSRVRALAGGVVGVRRLHLADTGGAEKAQARNVMHDKRVVRGSTFAAHPLAAGDGAESPAARAARTRRRALARRAAAARLRPGTPPPAPGRRHHPVQTEYYLEELFDKGVEMEVGVQTDLFVDRPASPAYVPAKTGADATTQIYPGDLFDFDLEVQPILEVVVGKSAEQALAEVAQEEELCALREQQRRYVELRDAERAERQRLAAQDQRLHGEKERRVAAARAAQAGAAQARERAAAAVLVHGYVAELLPAVLAGLRDQGYLMERVERGVDEEFLPWLAEQVSLEIESIVTSRDVITEIVRDVVEARAELHRRAAAAEAPAGAGDSEQSDSPRSPPAAAEEEEMKEE